MASGHLKAELNLVMIRKQQLWRECKAIAGKLITTQHKPVVFVVHMKRTTPNKTVGPKPQDNQVVKIYRWICYRIQGERDNEI